MKKKYDVGAYVWPAYTGKEPRAYTFWPDKIGEWQTIKSATAKFEGHSWPRKPLWGYVDEADPTVMEMQIDEATSHGVNVFIYDWYWYDKRPFLEQCLNDGFLKAKNRNKMKFYINWCNHNGSSFWDKRLSDDPEQIVWLATVDRKEFEVIVDRVINKYFKCENYYKINGCPVFNIHYFQNFIKGIGGVDEAASAIEYFREETKKAGFPDLHLQLNLVGCMEDYSGISMFGGMEFEFDKIFQKIRFDSATHYQFLAMTNMNREYEEVIVDAVKEWNDEKNTLPFTYFPPVSIGWDNNPRTHKLMPTICKNNTPDKVEIALREAKKFIDKNNLVAPLVTINSWNEWTETSYLEPDDLYGYGYLDAVKKVFVDEVEDK